MKKPIFIDTNIMLDLLGERAPYYEPIARIASLADKGFIKIVASALSYATVNYFLVKFEGKKIAKEKLRKFKIISEISGVDEKTVEKGLNSGFKDFEDSLQYFSALNAGCNIILTRNSKDFKLSEIPVMTAEEYLQSLK